VTWNIILGPPGTGKTTSLLNLTEDYLENGVEPHKIGYLAFTKKAANEALERASYRFNLDRKQLVYFRTIHSLCYNWLGLKTSDIMARTHYKEFSKIKEQAHSDYIIDEIKDYGLDIDVVVEAKAKELAVQRYHKKYKKVLTEVLPC